MKTVIFYLFVACLFLAGVVCLGMTLPKYEPVLPHATATSTASVDDTAWIKPAQEKWVADLRRRVANVKPITINGFDYYAVEKKDLVRFRERGGSDFWFEQSLCGIHNDDQRPIGVYLLDEDSVMEILRVCVDLVNNSPAEVQKQVRAALESKIKENDEKFRRDDQIRLNLKALGE